MTQATLRASQAAAAVLAAAAILLAAAPAAALIETPNLAADVKAGKLPPVEVRLPERPNVVPMDGQTLKIGKHGGDWRMIIPNAKDLRLLSVFGYARLVGWDRNFDLRADLLDSYDVQEGRIFTFKLRKGHRWSDGHPFTAEDFRYWWEDIANNADLSPGGPPRTLAPDGKPVVFEKIDNETLRYTFDKPNPEFLFELAGAAPLDIYRPAHYLKRFHVKYADPDELKAAVADSGRQGWAALHNSLDNMYKSDNVELPTLQPWMNTTKPPSTLFTAVRNPFFHKVDPEGRQLPYMDRVLMNMANAKLIPAKAGSGDVDLQARGLMFRNFTFLKESEGSSSYVTHLWTWAKGSKMALMPNLNANDETWRKVFRDVRFRRALSMAINRDQINETFYAGLARPVLNSMLPQSPLYNEAHATAFTKLDPPGANKLLDEMGLAKRNGQGTRLLPDGRAMDLIVETAGEDEEEVDILQLVEENLREIGIKLYIKPSQREVFRNRIFAGETLMSVWSGWENGLATPIMSPAELAPTTQQGLQWPKWGQHFETSGQAGEAPDLPEAKKLIELNAAWRVALDPAAKKKIWDEMLQIHADQLFMIGVANGVGQPVVVAKTLRNVPPNGLWNWDPGANFGMYWPDVFWFQK